MKQLLKVTANIRQLNSKKTGKTFGLQVCGLQTPDGFYKEFTQFFDPEKEKHFLEPGDYEVLTKVAYIDQDGRLKLAPEFKKIG